MRWLSLPSTPEATASSRQERPKTDRREAGQLVRPESPVPRPSLAFPAPDWWNQHRPTQIFQFMAGKPGGWSLGWAGTQSQAKRKYRVGL